MGFIPEKWFTKAAPSSPAPLLTPPPVAPVVPVVPVQEMRVPPVEEETVPMTWVDAAIELGIEVDSVKARARRGKWRRVIGNDRRALVYVPKYLIRAAAPTLKEERAPSAEPDERETEVQALLIGKMALADKLHVSYYIVDNIVNSEGFPKPIKAFKRKMWKISDVDEWFAKQIDNEPEKAKEMDVLSKYIIEKRGLIGGPASVRFVPPLVCRDGFEVSVQASAIHYSSPRVNEGPWTEFECGFPSKPVPELRQWREALQDDAPDEDCVFAYVPWAAVMLTIEKHGGCVVLEEMK